MPAVNGVGKPCAGEPHARIDGRELETEPERPRPRRRTTHGKPYRSPAAPRPTADHGHRASSRPSRFATFGYGGLSFVSILERIRCVEEIGLAEVGERLDAFVGEVFSSLGRRDRIA